MANRIPTERSRTNRPRIALGALAMLLTLGACETTDQIVDTVNPVNWFKDDPASVETETASAPAPSDDGTYPRIGPVEPVPPTPAIASEAAALRSALVADKENARYTDQVLRAQSEPAAREQQAAQARAQALSPTAPSPAAIPQASPSTAQVAASGATITPPPPRPAGAPTPVPTPVPVPVQTQGAASGSATPPPTPVAVATPRPTPVPAPTQTQAARPAPAPEPLPAATPTPAPAPAPAPIPTQTASLDRPTPPPPAPGVASAAPAAPASPAPQPQPEPTAEQRLIAYIYFPDGGAALSDADRDVIRQVAEIYRSSGGKGVALVGHSSGRTGTADALQGNLVNFKLSLDRATAVGNAFVAQGLDRDLVRIDARGASEPKFTEDSPTGEAGNRRVDVYILY